VSGGEGLGGANDGHLVTGFGTTSSSEPEISIISVIYERERRRMQRKRNLKAWHEGRAFTRSRVQSHDPDSHIDSHLPQQPTFPSPPRTTPTQNSATNNDGNNDNTASASPPTAPLHPLRHLATPRQRRRTRDPAPVARSTRAVLRRHALPHIPRRTLSDPLRRRVRHSRQRPKVK